MLLATFPTSPTAAWPTLTVDDYTHIATVQTGYITTELLLHTPHRYAFERFYFGQKSDPCQNRQFVVASAEHDYNVSIVDWPTVLIRVMSARQLNMVSASHVQQERQVADFAIGRVLLCTAHPPYGKNLPGRFFLKSLKTHFSSYNSLLWACCQ